METNIGINKYFDKVYCFCKPSNYDNWNNYVNIYKYYNIDVKLIPAEDTTSRVVNNVYASWRDRGLLGDNSIEFIADLLSHTTFINHAIDNKFDKILILKENVIPHKDYFNLKNNINIELNWDFLILKDYEKNIIGYGLTAKYYNDLLVLIKKFNLQFDQIINLISNNLNIFEINNLFFIVKDYSLNKETIDISSLFFNKKNYLILYPFNQVDFIKKKYNDKFLIYNQFDYYNWDFDFNLFEENIIKSIFNYKPIVFIGNSFCLKTKNIICYSNNIEAISIKEKIENIKKVNNFNLYPKLINNDENFILKYYDFYYDLIDLASYKVANLKCIDIDDFNKMEF
jgi:hypothetical protein